jgi:hypothetical protein
MKKLFKWIITIKLEIGTEITTVVTADTIGKACNAMKYTAERLNGEITKIERDEPIKDQECSGDQ